MALKLQSRDLYAIIESGQLDRNGMHQAYNALDSAVTFRVHEALKPLIEASPHATTSYRFTRAMQGPAFSMMSKGIMVQQKVRQDETHCYLSIREAAQRLLDRLADAVWGPEHYVERTKTQELHTPIGKRGQALTPRLRTITTEVNRQRPRGLNPASPKQVLAFFNGALGYEVFYEIRKTPQGTERTPSANDKALKRWADRRTKGPGIDVRDRTVYPVRLAAPFVSLILTIRDADKMLSVLRTPLDSDGRMRCSYNVVGTENGRWSSSKNAFGRGTNLQNITPSMRRMFCADDGWRLISTDLEQAESYIVAGEVWRVTGSRTYLDAILSGDLHTTVASMCWPELGWTDDAKANRKIANLSFPGLARQGAATSFSYRDVSKRLGHGTNYRGSAFGIGQAVGVPTALVDDFQARYFRAFPALRDWHSWVKSHLLGHQYLDTPLGRRRWFFGRPNEDSTLREAIAFVPQGTVGELLNLIMYKVWERSLEPPDYGSHLPIQLLLQNHDAFAFQTPVTTDLPRLIHDVNHEFHNSPITFVRGDEHLRITIPGEFVTGFNWAYADDPSKPRADWTFVDGNPDGLAKWSGSDTRTRTQRAAVSPADWLTSGGPPRTW